MATKYPNQIDTNTEIPLSTDNVTPIRAIVTNTLRGAILSVESELGIQPSGTFATVRARLDALETLLSVLNGGNVNILQPLDVVLNEGNTTEGINILLNNNSDLVLSSGSSIRSTTDTVEIDDNLSVNNNKVINVATPTVGTDAANKDYVDSLSSIIEIVALTGASNILDVSHAGKLLTVSHTSTTQLTVPNNSSEAFLVTTQIHLMQYGAGQLEVVADGGVTIRTSETLLFRKQYSMATLIKIDTNEWILTGDVELV